MRTIVISPSFLFLFLMALLTWAWVTVKSADLQADAGRRAVREQLNCQREWMAETLKGLPTEKRGEQ